MADWVAAGTCSCQQPDASLGWKLANPGISLQDREQRAGAGQEVGVALPLRLGGLGPERVKLVRRWAHGHLCALTGQGLTRWLASSSVRYTRYQSWYSLVHIPWRRLLLLSPWSAGRHDSSLQHGRLSSRWRHKVTTALIAVNIPALDVCKQRRPISFTCCNCPMSTDCASHMREGVHQVLLKKAQEGCDVSSLGGNACR